MRPSPLFDVEQFRAEPDRLAVSREVTRPTLVLGSTQPVALVARQAVTDGVDVVRRRGGGGAVFLQPGDHVWIDAWIPRADPLWQADVSAAAAWAGYWWLAALEGMGLAGLDVHAGRASPGELGELVCFAGRGPGEVFSGGRKVMGLSQWRSREGALFSACAYVSWDPTPLIALLQVDQPVHTKLTGQLPSVAAGVGDLEANTAELGPFRQALLSSFPTWGSGGAS